MLATQTTPNSETIRRTAQEILQRPDYQVEQQTRGGDALLDWILQILYWVITPFRWLFDAMEGLPDALRWVIVISLFLLLLLLIAHIVYTVVTSLQPTRRKAEYKMSVSKRAATPEEIEGWAREAVEQHDYIAAIRFLFRASLAHLQALEGRTFRPGLTNRAYLRRFRQSPVLKPLQSFVGTIDACWYGNTPCCEEDYLNCHAAYLKIRNHRKEPVHAHSA